jgi:hypothetical protein
MKNKMKMGKGQGCTFMSQAADCLRPTGGPLKLNRFGTSQILLA